MLVRGAARWRFALQALLPIGATLAILLGSAATVRGF